MAVELDLRITGKNLDITDAMSAMIRRKLDKLAAYLPRPAEAKVEILDEKTKSANRRYTAQVTITTKGTIIRGEEKAENVPTAVDHVAEVISRQVKRYVEKRHDRGRGTSPIRQKVKAPPTTVPAAPEEESNLPEKVSRVKRFSMKPMPVAEAVDQMELLGHDFYLFVNSESGLFSCLYRREDKTLGLIEAEQA